MVVASSAQQGASTQSESQGAMADCAGAVDFRELYLSALVSGRWSRPRLRADKS